MTTTTGYRGAYAERLTTPVDAAASIPNDATISVGMAAGSPPALLSAIADRVRADDLRGLKLYAMFAMAPLAETLLAEGVVERIDVRTLFLGGTARRVQAEQAASHLRTLRFVPVNFSQVPRIFEEQIELDTFAVMVSPMDRGGYFSLGVINDFASVAARTARRLLVEVNSQAPRVFGQSQIHVSEVDAIVEHDSPIPEAPVVEPSAEARVIGEHVAPLVPNGATIQLGVGRIPSGVADSLRDHEDLGIHTELFSPAMVDLIELGVVTGARKTRHPRKHVFTNAIGTKDTYEFINDNAAFESYPVSYVNDIRVIADHDNFVSINTAIEVDLYGQVNAEFLGGLQYSGVGGQFDFVKGASLSRGGVSVIALPSTAHGGSVSTIVPKVALVTDDRMDVEHVATEYGIVNLRGKTIEERALALIEIAHPDFRDQLRGEAQRASLI
jgi:itaconate CoA-transferase